MIRTILSVAFCRSVRPSRFLPLAFSVVRSIGYGFLVLAISVLPAIGQSPTGGLWPSLEEARNASTCDSTPWAKTIVDVKAANPERDAEHQITAGDFMLKWQRAPVKGAASLVLPEHIREKTSELSSSSTVGKAFNTRRSEEFRFIQEKVPTGVACYLDVQLEEAFPISDYVEDASTSELNKWCVRAALVLTNDYAERFNRRIVGDPAYPDKDVCAAVRTGNHGPFPTVLRWIGTQPTPDLIPTRIPDIATAARFGLADRVAKFIGDGADIGQTDVFGFDAWKWAVVRDYRAIFDLLMAASGKVDFCAVLATAVTYGRVEMVAPLAGRCAPPEKRLRLLTFAVGSSDSVAFSADSGIVSFFDRPLGRGNFQIVRALVDVEPAPLLSGSKEVESALFTAASESRLDLARLLLDRAGAEPKTSREWWDGLLEKAIARWRLGLADLLLERGAHPDPNTVHYAVDQRAAEVVRTLVKHGADLNGARPQPLQRERAVQKDVPPDPLGRPPLLSPPPHVRFADPPIFLALDPLMDFKMVDLLLDLGADPNVRDSSGRTPLMVAISQSRIYGKKNGMGGIEWYVPQHLIVGQEDWAHRGVEPVRALLAKSADVGLTDKEGLSALHYAAHSDYNVEIAQILLEHGADINARDAGGRTPLDHARAANLVRMPQILTAAGARSGGQ
jgi:ankyrin repeat protein